MANLLLIPIMSDLVAAQDIGPSTARSASELPRSNTNLPCRCLCCCCCCFLSGRLQLQHIEAVLVALFSLARLQLIMRFKESWCPPHIPKRNTEETDVSVAFSDVFKMVFVGPVTSGSAASIVRVPRRPTHFLDRPKLPTGKVLVNPPTQDAILAWRRNRKCVSRTSGAGLRS